MLTDLTFLQPGAPWPPEDRDTRDRLQMYKDNRLLWDGEHVQVFKDALWRVLREDQQTSIEFTLNWPKRLSTFWADMLLGEAPRFSTGDQGGAEQARLDEIIERNSLISQIYEGIIDVSRFGDGPLKVRRGQDGKAIIEPLAPNCWLPVVDPFNVKNVLYHVLAVATEAKLTVEIHERGRMTRQEYALADKGNKIERRLTTQTEDTGADDFLIIPLKNLTTSDRATGIDDYTDLASLNQEFEVRLAQISRILDKHADPNLYGPSSGMIQDADGRWVMPINTKFWPIEPGDSPPGYVTWDGQLASCYKELEILLEQFWFLSETSPACFGLQKSGLAESGSALKRLMMAPLKKVDRLKMHAQPAIIKALRIASRLEGAEIQSIKIEWADGLPQDDTEQATVLSTLYMGGLMSLETALRRQGFEGESLTDEMARIREDQKVSQPQPVTEDKGVDIMKALGGAAGGTS